MKKKLVTSLATGFWVLGIVGGASAATVFLDDFDDGNSTGWLATASGNGSTSVESHNSSKMAAVKHTGNGLHSLSMDFSYLDNNTLSFDMHAVAYSATSCDAWSGVKVSFLNSFNTTLGATKFIRTTKSGSLGPNDYLIDNVQHNYTGSMSTYAALAGLDAADSISKLSLTYFTNAQTAYFTNGYRHSSGTVWFDNVTVNNAVPVPGAVWLLGSGLLGLVGIKRQKE